MALVYCPECGNPISDKATMCVHCGYPVNEMVSEVVKIKLIPVIRTGLLWNGRQNVTIYTGRKVAWQGESGMMAEFELKGKAWVRIVYHTGLWHWGGAWNGAIDPEKGKKYALVAKQGFLGTNLTLCPVEVFTA